MQTRTQLAARDKEKKLQFVQYECIKSELKEEYDKKVGFLNRRLNMKAQKDPSFLLLNNMTALPTTAKNKKASVFEPLHESEDVTRKQMQLQKKILSGPSTKASSVNRNKVQSQELNRKNGEDDDGKNVNKSEYYKFYLNNAQKAINLMIAQHKSQGNLMQPIPSSQERISRHHNFEIGSSTGDLSYEGESRAQKAMFAHRNRDRDSTAQAYSTGGQPGLRKRSGLAGTEIRRNQRLEPLVNGHKKISRIAIARQDKSYDSKLE